MDRFYNAKSEKQTIYEIFRACRLCGAGGGYKMPIIQNVVDLDTEVELRQKIKECVQIEVDAEDKMPPLICEICIEKVNDFYEFLEMCRLTNRRTRQRLGLPPLTARGALEQEDCILGVTEPVFVNNDSEDEPLLGPAAKCGVAKKAKLPEPGRILVVKLEKPPEKAPRGKEAKPSARNCRAPSPARPKDAKTLRSKGRQPSPSPATSPVRVRDSKSLRKSPARGKEDGRSTLKAPSPVRGRDGKSADGTRSARKGRMPTPSPPRGRSRPGPASRTARAASPSSEAKRVTRTMAEEEERMSSRSSRSDSARSKTRKPEPAKAQKSILKKEPPPKEKEVKPEEPPPRPSKKRPAEKESIPSPVPIKKVKLPPPAAPKAAPPPVECQVCRMQLKNPGLLANHLRSHHVNFTNPKLACNACGEWFDSPDETHAHHKVHRSAHTPYRCRHCLDTFSGYTAFNEHHESNACCRYFEFPDVTCAECQRSFPTWALRDRHRCPGEDGRPGGKCSKCRRSYALLKNLTKHEATCTAKRRGQLIIDPEVMKEIRPTQIVVERCDALLSRCSGGHVDVSAVSPRFGLDRRREYPYFNTSLRVKTDPDGMVNITDELLNFVHWDSDYTSDGDTTSMDSVKPRQVDSLTTLSLKVIYSSKFLGKLPRRRRKKIKVEAVKSEVDAFDSMFNNEESFSKDMDRIMKTLDEDWDIGSDPGDRSILRGVMGVSLPNFASSVRIDDAVAKVGVDAEKCSIGADADVESDLTSDVALKSGVVSEDNKDVTDRLETGSAVDKIVKDMGEKTESTNENSLKNTEVAAVTKDSNETTERMDVDDESVEPGEELKDSTEETPAKSTETKEDVAKGNGIVSKDSAVSQVDLPQGDLPESGSADADKSINDDLGSKIAVETLNTPIDSSMATNSHHNDITPRSEPKCDDFSIESILKPSEQVNINSSSTQVENKVCVTSNGATANNISNNKTEMEVEELMDELDAQIVKTEDQVLGKRDLPSESFNHSSPLKTNVNKNTAMDLDNISDEEFNFD